MGFSVAAILSVIPISLTQKPPKTIGFTFPNRRLGFKHWKHIRRPRLPKRNYRPTQDANTSPIHHADPSSKRLGEIGRPTYYVLQPPLESLVDSANLKFPFPPFPYQMEGIASSSHVTRPSWLMKWGLAKTCRPSRPSHAATLARGR